MKLALNTERGASTLRDARGDAREQRLQLAERVAVGEAPAAGRALAQVARVAQAGAPPGAAGALDARLVHVRVADAALAVVRVARREADRVLQPPRRDAA